MNKLGVVVPFRNRWGHYSHFVPKIKRQLKRQRIDFEIIVVEQDNGAAFNRGMLCNIGFLEAKKLKCTYVVFHDIDMIPDDIDYSYSDVPIHLATANLPFESYFGGITLFPNEIFEKINGFSNVYWGWGYEDDDLRYRCVSNGIKFAKNLNTQIEVVDKVAVFNGLTSYIKVENCLKVVRDFHIKISMRLGKVAYDLNKDQDKFNLLNIDSGYNFDIFYSSFRRLTVQFFDSKGEFYQLVTDPIGNNANELEVIHNVSSKTVELIHNGRKISKVVLNNRLYNYSRAKHIFIGSSSDLGNKFKGSIDSFSIEGSKGNTECSYYSTVTKDYKWQDHSTYNRNAELNNIEFKQFKAPINYNGYIPYRRMSKYTVLSHEDSGFIGGRWKDDLTRWNQLRYNNEINSDEYKNTEDGLNNCQYHVHSKKHKRSTLLVKVGIN
jgi:hypothetical protein